MMVRIKLISSIILIFFSCLSYANRCEQNLNNLPSIGQFEEKIFSSGKSYRLYNKGTLQVNEQYQQMLHSSVEVIAENSPPFGHLRLRVGDQIYSMNYIQSTSQRLFRPNLNNVNEVVGFVYLVDPSEILKLQDEISRFFKSSQDYNVPGFDAFSPPLKIINEGNQLRYKSPSAEYANNELIRGEIIKDADEYFLTSPNYKIKVQKINNNEYEVPSFSCVSATTYWLKKFNIDIYSPWNLEAKEVKKLLLNPNRLTSEPDLIIHY
jgi:hypothetical protein